MKRLNKAGVIFGTYFLILTVLKWSNRTDLDNFFGLLGAFGLLLLGISPLLDKSKK